MRSIDERAIKAHADLRFRSEYDYALFEYYRSAKVIAFLERAGVAVRGRVLDAGCGGGGMPLSLAEEAALGRRHRSRRPVPGRRRAARRASAGLRNLHFALADGMCSAVRATATFDLVLSHAVIEHVADAPLYLRECARVLAPGGHVYLSTAPYLSFAGAHLPRLKLQLPLHLMVGRRAAFATFRSWRGTRPGRCKEPAHENSFIKAARRGEVKQDDLLEKVRRHAAAPADRRRRPAHRPRGAARRRQRCAGCRRRSARWLRDSPLTQDALSATWNTCSDRRRQTRLADDRR